MYNSVRIFISVIIFHHLAQCFGCYKGSTILECVGLSGHFLKADDSLNVFDMRIEESNTVSLSSAEFSQFPELKRLTIVDSVVLTQENLFEHLYALEELSIIGCNVSESVAVLYANNTNIKILQLSKNNISRVTKQLLHHLHQIEQIDLSYNRIASLEEDVFSKMKSLQKLDLSHNDIGGTFIPFLLTMKSRCLRCTVYYEDIFIKEVDTSLCDGSKMIDILWRKFHSYEIIHLNGNPVCQIAIQNMVSNYSEQKINDIIYFKKCPKHASRYLFLRESCSFGNDNFDHISGGSAGTEKSTSSSSADNKAEVDDQIFMNSSPDNHDHLNDKSNAADLRMMNNALYVTLPLVAAIIMLTLILAIIQFRNQTDPKKYPLHQAVKENNLAKVENLLKKASCDVHEWDSLGDTPLHHATGNIKMMELLVEYGADVNALNKDKKTPIVVAVWHGNEKSVEWLIKKGVDFDKKSKYDQSQFGNAAKDGHTNIVKMLLERGAEIDQKDQYGNFPIHQAARNGHSKTVAFLLEKGSPVNCKDKRGNTPLHYAARKGHDKVVKLLLDKKPSIVDITNNKGSTPLHKAAKGGHKETIELLLERNALLRARNKNGDTPLHFAAKAGQTETVAFLQEKRGDIRVENERGQTPEQIMRYQWLRRFLKPFKLFADKYLMKWILPLTRRYLFNRNRRYWTRVRN